MLNNFDKENNCLTQKREIKVIEDTKFSQNREIKVSRNMRTSKSRNIHSRKFHVIKYSNQRKPQNTS